MSESFVWTDLSKKKRAKVALRALDERDYPTLCSLVQHHQLHYGRSASQTSPRTFLQYRGALRKFLRFTERMSTRRLLEGDPDLGAAFLGHLHRDLKPGSVNNARSGVRALYRALRWAGATQSDPFADIPPVRDNVPAHLKREAYSNEDVEKLLAVADPMERVMVLMAAQAGLRIHEVVKLQWSDIDLEAREVMVIGKGRKAAKVHLSAALVSALEALPTREGRVLRWRQERTLRDHLKRLCEKGQVRYSKRQFHGLRHHCATRLHDETGDLMLTAAHLRHSSTQTTETYAKGDRRKIAAVVNHWGEAAAS
ncbi:tyrosine-type recombinase/integrase [Deinococcus peraridilitoris]|uniref:Site-specific recombinase XerC n=1 Tax=Deinococcus peraridilitoris (strain DSM 19664 / LMG 22246 / CIP 109416 / KR-200) TaxID=937777 RepID=K9ZWU5_DEIPD|nr:site-specific integrase [Deinococcus peraridilitoris]AFZ66051.1 site-specific recombinase XerC [Deinococcus peraridilitoris DSM 19664]